MMVLRMFGWGWRGAQGQDAQAAVENRDVGCPPLAPQFLGLRELRMLGVELVWRWKIDQSVYFTCGRA